MYRLYRYYDKNYIRDIRTTDKVFYCRKTHMRKIDFSSCVRLTFPPPAENPTKRKAQEINYAQFIHVMADMVKKYNTSMQN